MKKLAGIALITALSTGCVGHYPQPQASAPHATLEAVEGDSQLVLSSIQVYWGYYDVACTDTPETGVLGTRKQDATERFLLRPDRRIFIGVLSTGGLRKTDGYYRANCVNVGSFIPAAGATYQVRQKVAPQDCAISITDARTGQPPESFRRETVQGECRLDTRD